MKNKEKSYGAFVKKSYGRFVGTIIGGFSGLLLMTVVFLLPPECFQCSYKPWTLAVGTALFCGLFSYRKIKYSASAYLYLTCSLTLVIVVLGEYSRDDDVEDGVYHHYTSAVQRLFSVMIGVCVSFIVSNLFPVKSSSLIPEVLGEILLETSNLIDFITNSRESSDLDNFNNADLFNNELEIELEIKKFKQEAFKKMEKISKITEKMKVELELSDKEMFLNQLEVNSVKFGKSALEVLKKIFYLTNSIISFGKIFHFSLTINREFNFRLFFEIISNSMKKVSKLLQNHRLNIKNLQKKTNLEEEEEALVEFGNLNNPREVLPLVKKIINLVKVNFREFHLKVFNYENLKKSNKNEINCIEHVEKFGFSEWDWINFNNFVFNFLQILNEFEELIEILEKML
ncbi:hypothetical protein HK099_001060 [Clydaea vesicula]|uniref:Uncharacterized protein n=1 Tax=Clydaea vesicula TaxID=447962 RepID=A0AAD5XX63_9FUNG|nr:hypothetical protein HK099_001060 [Clydaea vesicula]